MAKRPNDAAEDFEIDGHRLTRRGSIYVADNRKVVGGQRTGKRTTLGKFDSIKEAKDALRSYTDSRKVLLQQQAQHTVGSLWAKWLADREKNGFSNDIYEANWASLGPHFAHISVGSLTEDDCRDYARQRFAMGRKPATVNTELSRLRACLAWAAIPARKLLSVAPLVWVPQPGKPRTFIITPEEAWRLLVASEDELHVYVFIVLALTTAARHSAILELTWDRIDFERGMINYEVLIDIDPMSKAWRKGRAEVTMNALARAALLRAKEAAQSDYVIEYRGKPLKSIRESFALAVARAGLGVAIPAPTRTKPNRVHVRTKVTPHTIRHSVNSWLQEKGVAAEQRAKLLGHANVNTNVTTYSHGRAEKMLGRVVEVLGEELISHATRTGADTADSGVENDENPPRLVTNGPDAGISDRSNDAP